jgi:hypothetical protein
MLHVCFSCSCSLGVNKLLLLLLQENENIQYIFTRRLNQDTLENLFGSIRQQHGNCINPTPIQFERTFRKICCTRLFNSGNDNCEGDIDDFLLKITTATRLEEEIIQASVSPTMLPTLTVKTRTTKEATYWSKILQDMFVNF